MKKLFLALALLLVIANYTNADLNYTSTNCQGNGDLLNTLNSIPNCITESFFAYLISGLISSIQGFVDSSFQFLFALPNITSFCAPFQAVMSILETLFSLALMALALFFIIRSNDVEGRITAKKWLENLLIMIVLLSFSFVIFQIALNLNTHLSTSLANDSMKSIFNPTASLSSPIFILLMLLLTVIFLVSTFLTLLLRYVLIPFLLLLFPIAIFLYFIPLTQNWGKAYLKTIGIILFMTTVDAIVLLGVNALFTSSDPNLVDPLVRAFAVLIAFGAIGIINSFLFITSALSIISESKTASAIVGIAVARKVLK